mgnify:CR=1 FL=1
MIEAYIICYKNKVSERIYYSLIKNIKEVSLKKSKLIIVIGGDGFMLQTLKKFHQYKNFGRQKLRSRNANLTQIS